MAARIQPQILALCAGLLGPACAMRPPPPQTSPTKPISFAILEDYDKGADLRLVARDFHLMKQLGVPVWRGSFGWDDYEPSAGAFDFSWLRQFVQLAADSGIALRPYLAYTPEWIARGGADGSAWNDPPADPEIFAAFTDTLARTFASSSAVLSWEIYNEQNVQQWWEGSAEEYAATLASAAAAIRTADADAFVFPGGLVWPDTEWIETVCAAATDAVDVIAVHAYPGTWTPDSVTVENYLGRAYVDEFLPAAHDACGVEEIWINEAGFATTAGRSEREQAVWWARAIATFLSAPAVTHIGIYEIRDLEAGREVIGDAANYHLGITRVDGTPKLAYHTIALLVRLLGPRIRIVNAAVQSHGTVHHRLFERPDGVRVLVAWSLAGERAVTLRLDRPAAAMLRYDLDGRIIEERRVGTDRIGPADLRQGDVWIIELRN